MMGRFADLDIEISERVDRTEETPEEAERGLTCDRFLSPPSTVRKVTRVRPMTLASRFIRPVAH